MKRAHPKASLRKTGLAGAGLVGLTGIATAISGWLLDLDGARESDICLYIGLVLVTLGGLLATLPWERLPQRALLLGPAIVTFTLGIVGLLIDSQSQPLLAFLLLSVVFVGLTQPPGVTTLASPVLLADWWLAFPSHPASLLLRLPLVILVVLVCGEVTAWTQRRWTLKVAALWASSNTDPLTNIGNRRALARHLAALPANGSVMFVDLDNFKTFNDRYGHAAGDIVLMQFANVVTSVLRADDVVARFGGEEFVVLVNGAVEGPEIYARIRDAWHVAGAAVTFSAGVARREGAEAPAVTLSRADAALYQAKVNGRDRFELASRFEDTTAVPRRGVGFDDDDFTVRDLLDQINQRHPTPSTPVENVPAQPND